jgi:O-antigen/teichoic acid export membrane protein
VSEERSLGHRALSGLFWAYGSYIGGRALTLVSIAILARVLTPREFGLVALGVVFIALLETVKDLGMTQALVVSKGKDVQSDANTVFFITLSVGVALMLITAGLAPGAASFFREPDLMWILVALGTNFVLRGAGLTHYALAQKQLDFRVRTMAEFSNVTARGIVSIILALSGFGAWSLVIGYLLGSAVFTIVLWALVPFRPRPPVSFDRAKELMSFGGKLIGVDALWAVSAAAPELIIGRALTASSLGLYTIGLRLPELVILNFSVVAAQVFYPAFATLRARDLTRGLLTAFRYSTLLGLPLTCFLVVLAEPIILTVFGDQWHDSIEPMQALCIFAFAVTLGIPAGSALKASGRAGILVILDAIRAALVIAWVLLVVDEGILHVAIAVAGATLVLTVVELAVVPRLLDFSPLQMVAEVWQIVIAAAALTVVLVVVNVMIPSDLMTIILGALLGGAVYFGMLWLIARDTLIYIVEKARA